MDAPKEPPTLDAALALPLSALAGCWLHIQCCKGVVIYPVKLMASRYGDGRLSDALNRLRCLACGGAPASVWLSETPNLEPCGGAPPGWSIELVRKGQG
jgi:hypothetical protein